METSAQARTAEPSSLADERRSGARANTIVRSAQRDREREFVREPAHQFAKPAVVGTRLSATARAPSAYSVPNADDTDA
jgi:hypothetical protein